MQLFTQTLVFLTESSYYPYHIQSEQARKSADFLSIANICQWYCNKINNDLIVFLSKILGTGEVSFSRDGIINFYNHHQWTEESLHAIFESHHQHKFSTIVRVVILGNQLI